MYFMQVKENDNSEVYFLAVFSTVYINAAWSNWQTGRRAV